MMATATSPPPFGPSSSPKKLRHKASKPIITWITKKLGGAHTARAASASASDDLRPGPVRGRSVSLPMTEPVTTARTVVLNDDQDIPTERNSTTTDSMWTKMSPANEADEDASIRPLPPTSPPSPTPSRSSSSQFSDPRTFRSGAASTKPTTLMSIDSANGVPGTMAHIAVVPSSPSTSIGRYSSPLVHPAVARAVSRHRFNLQAPLHTYHHPRNNPNPTSPPADNASTLTLASSAFALSARANDWTDGVSLSLDAYQADGDVNSSHMGLEDDEGEFAASVRALRPRSSRRGSWESEESRWSARVGSGMPNVGAPSVVSGSGMTRASSIGGQSVARSLSIGKLKIGLGVSDHEGRKQGDEKDQEEEDDDNDDASIKPSDSGFNSQQFNPPLSSPNDATITASKSPVPAGEEDDPLPTKPVEVKTE